MPDAQPKPTAADYDADDHPLQYAFDLVAHTLHRPGCDHHTGGPADCDSRAMTAVAALRDAGLLATPEHDGERFSAGYDLAMSQVAHAQDGSVPADAREWLAKHDAQVLRAWGELLLDRYPEDVFVPPSRDAYDRVHRARGATGVSLDALSADAMRRAARLAIQDAARIEAGEPT